MTDEVPADNAAQVDYWNARVGETWARHQDALDRQLGPLGRAAIDRLQPRSGEAVLDIGCGCGQTTLQLAEAVGPAGRVTGIDISRPMLAIARARPRAATSAPVRFLEADAQTTRPDGAPFDAAFSRFGVMFFADPVAAFANVLGALRPAGRLVFVCWRVLDDNGWMLEPLTAARPYLPPLPATDPHAPGPFAFADGARIRDLLERAGYTGIAVERYDTEIGIDTLDEATELALRIGPLGSALRDHPGCRDAVAGAVRDVLARRLAREGVRSPASVWLVSAQRSGGA